MNRTILLIVLTFSFLTTSLVASAGGSKSAQRRVEEAPVAASARPYDRAEFRHWIDADGDCQNTRQEILIARSLVPVKLNKKGCTVKAGRWNDFYYDEVLERASDVDIDHVIPLKHAWDIGASAWTAEQREKFANDPENLVVTNRKYNRQKGAKTIMEWMPVNRAYACKYAAQWFQVKEKYHLPISAKEHEFRDMLKCESATK